MVALLASAAPVAAADGAVNLRVFVRGQTAEAGAKTSLTVYVDNYAGFAGGAGATATNVVVTIDLPTVDIVRPVAIDPFTCDLTIRPIVCRAPSLAANQKADLVFRIVAPSTATAVSIGAHVSAAESDSDLRDNYSSSHLAVLPVFTVTTTSDSGPGSLRQAILDSNASDCGCAISFRLPPPLPEAGFFTIQPRSPLPAVARSAINGAAEATLLDRDEAGPPLVMLDGSLQPSGDGLVFTGGANVSDLAIGNFRRNGIDVQAGRSSYVTGCYLGLDPKGRPAPNERGYVDYTPSVDVASCVIGSNLRSGIWVVNGSVTLYKNRIGVAPDSDDPRPNGASGVFLIADQRIYMTDNVIANNAHAGIALTVPKHDSIEFYKNSIYANGAAAVDFNLDGLSPNVADDVERFANRPVITRAVYNARTDETRVDVVVSTTPRPLSIPSFWPPASIYGGNAAAVELYANDAPRADLQRWLGDFFVGTLPEHGPGAVGTTITVKGDLRGKWITAIASRASQKCYLDMCQTSLDVSEASDAAPVR